MDITHSFLHDLQLDDPNPNVQKCFRDLMRKMETIPLSFITLGREKPGVLAYYVASSVAIPHIVIPSNNATWDELTNTIKFKDPNTFVTLLHEVMHMFHFARDKGVFVTPQFRNLKPVTPLDYSDPDLKYKIEYEAGYRSMVCQINYKLYDDDRVKLNNLRNMYFIVNKNEQQFSDMGQSIQRATEQRMDIGGEILKERILNKHFATMRFSDCVDKPITIELDEGDKGILATIDELIDVYMQTNGIAEQDDIRDGFAALFGIEGMLDNLGVSYDDETGEWDIPESAIRRLEEDNARHASLQAPDAGEI